jgi:hypothetical protein
MGKFGERLPLAFFGGADPASSSALTACDGAWLVAYARDRRDPEVEADWTRPLRRDDFDFNFCHARVLRGLGHLEWAAFLHDQHRAWRFENLALDYGAGGGGPEIERRLAVADQALPQDIRRVAGVDLFMGTTPTRVRPIVTRSNHQLEGDYILTLVKRGEPLIDRLWPGLTNDKKLVDEIFTLFLGGLKSIIGLPRGFAEIPAEEHKGWPQELIELLKLFGALKSQAAGVTVETDENGAFVFYAGGSRNFLAKGRKDILMAAMYCYLAFATWVEAMASGLFRREGEGCQDGTW